VGHRRPIVKHLISDLELIINTYRRVVGHRRPTLKRDFNDIIYSFFLTACLMFNINFSSSEQMLYKKLRLKLRIFWVLNSVTSVCQDELLTNC